MTVKAEGQVRVEVKPMRAAIKDVAAAIEGRNTVPILSNLLIRAAPGAATLCGTDLDVLVERHIDLIDAGQGKGFVVTVEAKLLAGIFAKLPADAVADLSLKDGKVIVSAGRARFTLPTLPADDFPVIPAGEWDAEWEMDGGQLDALFDAVAFAQSTEDTRYYLNGIFLHCPDAALIAAATDGSRLARAYMDAPEGAEEIPDAIVSRKTVKLLGGLLADHAGKVDVALGTGKIRFAIGATVLTAKLVDGTFPDYTRVIPVTNDKAVWFDPKALAEAVERVTTIATKKTRAVKMTFGGDVLRLDVASPEHGLASEDMAIDYSGPEIVIGFNGAYVLDVCRQLKGDTAQVLLADPQAPTLWRDAEEAARTYTLMPLRV